MAIKETKEFSRGMRDVVAAETTISFVDGENNKLYYQGYDVDDLAGRVCHDETVYLIWNGDLPNLKQLRGQQRELVGEMRLPDGIIRLLRDIPSHAHPMVVLRSLVSAMGMVDPEAEDNSLEANLRKRVRVTAWISTLIAAYYRVSQGLDLLEPDPEQCLSYNFLYMFRGREPDPEEQKAMDLLLMLHTDHGMNASTFAARVTASTLADIYSATASALATLKGPLHGGANQHVMEMLEDIEHPERVDEFIDTLLDQKKRIMGFGHAVYKGEDPRAKHLRTASEALCSRADQARFYEMSHRIETLVREKKGIFPNVDFYSASVQHALGIPKEFFTTVFAASRVAGWTAHVIEQYADNRLIRPTSKYMGLYGRKFVPLEERP
jgi:citrate synthase